VTAERITTHSVSVYVTTGGATHQIMTPKSETWKVTKCSTQGIGEKMDTSVEALFRDMMNNGWFMESDGDVGSHVGYFGYVNNTKRELFEIRQNFYETIGAYGDPKDEDIIGSFVCTLDSNGNFLVHRQPSQEIAKQEFRRLQREYEIWAAQ